MDRLTLEVVTASEEMCYLMALDDVQKLAEATTSVTKKEHAHWYWSKFEGKNDDEESEPPSRAQKSSGALAPN